MTRSMVLNAFSLLLLAGCGDDPTGPTSDDVVGPWAASEFTLRQGSDPPVDMRAAGTNINLIFQPGGEVTFGHLRTTTTPQFGPSITLEFSGTWTLVPGGVRMRLDGFPGLEDVTWRFDPRAGTLHASGDIGNGVVATITLFRCCFI